MDNTLVIFVLQILGIILASGIIITGGYLLKKKFGNKKVDDTIDSLSQIINIITLVLIDNDFGDEKEITKIKFYISETLVMLKNIDNMPKEDLINLGIRNIKKLCYDNDIKLTDSQCEIARLALLKGFENINFKK